MDFVVKSITVEQNSILPSLLVSIEVSHYYNMEALISISGTLRSGFGVTIAHLSEHEFQGERVIDLKLFDENQTNEIYSGANKYRSAFYITLTALLTPKAVQHIEEVREKTGEKSVLLGCKLVSRIVTLPYKPKSAGGPQTNDTLIAIKTKEISLDQYKISQSDWINSYAKPLGIGNYLLLELNIPSKHEVDEAWTELYHRLRLRLSEIETANREGDWQKAMIASRQFYEIIDFKEKRLIKDKELREALKELFIKDNHSIEGFQNFMTGISSFFNFTSKYFHDKNNRDGEYNPVPNPTKEDAYFVYALALGLLNIIGKKTGKSSGPIDFL
jgi:hypothetical protein